MLGGSEIYLDDSKNNFERGSIDNFVLEFPLEKECGTPLTKVSGVCVSCFERVAAICALAIALMLCPDSR